MLVSRLANTWKCLNLFYSYYFRGMHFLLFFFQGKVLHVIFYYFVMVFELGDMERSLPNFIFIEVLTVLRSLNICGP